MNITFKYLYFLKQCFTVCANVLSLKFDKDGSCLLEINSVIIQASGNNSQQYFCIIITRFSTYIWTTYLMMKKITIAFTTTQRIKKRIFLALHQTFYDSYSGLTSLDLYRKYGHSYMHYELIVNRRNIPWLSESISCAFSVSIA